MHCNTISFWAHPSCHSDPVGGNPDYMQAMFYQCSGIPPLDGHCDESVGCQGTFQTLQKSSVANSQKSSVANSCCPASCCASQQSYQQCCDEGNYTCHEGDNCQKIDNSCPS